MSWLLTFLGIIALIVIHELGHFVAAKTVGMRVERFSLFFGPKIVGFTRGETEYRIGTIPLGGYVKIAGMGPAERMPLSGGGQDTDDQALEGNARHVFERLPASERPGPDPREYFGQPVWKRIVVIAAGPAMNVILAFAILWGVYATNAERPLPHRATVALVDAGTPAASALRKGDTLLAVDGRTVAFHGEKASFSAAVGADRCAGTATEGCRGTAPVVMTVLRNGRRIQVSAYPRYNAKLKRMLVGFTYQQALANDTVAQAAGDSIDEMGHITSRTVSRVGQIFTSEHARKEVHTIVAVSKLTSEAFDFNAASALFILALLSLSLAIVNLFPFLPLDGGHIFWAVAEKVRRRPIPFAVMERASILGIMLVGIVFAIGLSNDIHSLTNGSLTLHR
jgi:regulator of sigma E protease